MSCPNCGYCPSCGRSSGIGGSARPWWGVIPPYNSPYNVPYYYFNDTNGANNNIVPEWTFVNTTGTQSV